MACIGHVFPIGLTTSVTNATVTFQKTYFYLTRPIILIMLSFARDRAKQVVEKLYFMAALLVSSMEDRASRRSYFGVLCQVNYKHIFI